MFFRKIKTKKYLTKNETDLDSENSIKTLNELEKEHIDMCAHFPKAIDLVDKAMENYCVLELKVFEIKLKSIERRIGICVDRGEFGIKINKNKEPIEPRAKYTYFQFINVKTYSPIEERFIAKFILENKYLFEKMRGYKIIEEEKIIHLVWDERMYMISDNVWNQ